MRAVKFEVRYPTGTVHEVELQGTLAVIGRDPSCDLVLNDAKCSRRHAVVEAGPQGLSIRDSGSANGIYVNGKRVERSGLQQGDEVRLGEVTMKVLPEEVSGTLVMGPDEIVDLGPATSDSTPTVPPEIRPPSPAPAPPATVPPALAPTPPALASTPRPAPPPARPAAVVPSAPAAAAPPPPPAPPPPRLQTPPRPAPAPPALAPAAAPAPAPPPAAPIRPAAALRQSAPEPLPRPLTATILAALWLLNSALCVLGVVGLLFMRNPGWVLSAVFNLAFAGLGVALGIGLWGRKPWARMLQIGVSGFGLLTCVMTPLSALSLFYMMRPAPQILFSGRDTFRALTDEEADIVRKAEGEGMFAGGVFVALFLGLLLGGAMVFAAIKLLPAIGAS
jgi:hypothetical protein